jgi:hypothetical protein
MRPTPALAHSHPTRRAYTTAFRSLALLAILLTCPTHAEVVAVSSEVFNGYSREQLPDRTFKPELYVFGEGGRWTRPINDPEMDKLTFPQIVKVVAGALAKMNFRPALKSPDATLLILVFWGSTEGSDKVGPMNPFRQMMDARNARILGYTKVLNTARSLSHAAFAQEIMAEVGEHRYYVVLQAYDFKVALKEKKLKALWTTRMSLSESGEFIPALEHMVSDAARHFGKTTDGLLRSEFIQEGSVELAPLQVMEVIPHTK